VERADRVHGDVSTSVPEADAPGLSLVLCVGVWGGGGGEGTKIQSSKSTKCKPYFGVSFLPLYLRFN